MTKQDCKYTPQIDIKLPVGLPTAFMQVKKSALAPLCTYLVLKTLHANGVILNFWSKEKELAKYVGIGRTQFQKHYNKLKDLGLIEKRSRRIHFASRNKMINVLKEHFYISSTQYYKIEKMNYRELQVWFRYSASKDRVQAQHFAIELANFKQTKKEGDTFSLSSTCDFRTKQFGRKAIANSMGCLSLAAGSRWMKKFKEAGYIKYDRKRFRKEFECDNLAILKTLRKEIRDNGNSNVTIQDGCLITRLCNEIYWI